MWANFYRVRGTGLLTDPYSGTLTHFSIACQKTHVANDRLTVLCV